MQNNNQIKKYANSKPKAIIYNKNNISYYYKSHSKACMGLNISVQTLYKYLKIGKYKGGILKRISSIPKKVKIRNKPIIQNTKFLFDKKDIIKMLKIYDLNKSDSDEEKENFINKYIECH